MRERVEAEGRGDHREVGVRREPSPHTGRDFRVDQVPRSEAGEERTQLGGRDPLASAGGSPGRERRGPCRGAPCCSNPSRRAVARPRRGRCGAASRSSRGCRIPPRSTFRRPPPAARPRADAATARSRPRRPPPRARSARPRRASRPPGARPSPPAGAASRRWRRAAAPSREPVEPSPPPSVDAHPPGRVGARLKLLDRPGKQAGPSYFPLAKRGATRAGGTSSATDLAGITTAQVREIAVPGRLPRPARGCVRVPGPPCAPSDVPISTDRSRSEPGTPRYAVRGRSSRRSKRG